MRAQDFIEIIRRQLNDDGCKRQWTDQHILDALNEATCFVAEVRPDLFEEQIEIELTNSDIIEPPEGYRSVTRVLENLDPITKQPTGKVIEETDSEKQPIANRYAGIDCGTGGVIDVSSGIRKHTIEQAKPLGSSKEKWSVTPPVPSNGVAVVRVMAVRASEPITATNVKLMDSICRVMAVVKSFVLMRMFELDTESAYAADHAKRYQSQVDTFLGVTYRQQAVYHSGWWMGQEGEGDEEARRR